MWISDFSIRKPVVTTVVTGALAVFGLVALFVLDTDEYPEVSPPVIHVDVFYPGASPTVVERELVEPLEKGFASIPGVERLSSVSMDNVALLTVEFSFDKDLQEASQDIRDEIAELRHELPPEIEEPVIVRFDPNDLPIVSATLASRSRGRAELTRIAEEQVEPALRALPGVAQIYLRGAVERELTIELRPDAMQAAGIGVNRIIEALQMENLAVPVGRVQDDLDERSIRLRGRLASPSDFEGIVVAGAGDRVVRLGDLATARDSTDEPRTIALYNGEPAVSVDVVKARGFSTTSVAEEVRKAIAGISGSLPEDVELEIVRDAGARVERSVSDVQSTLVEGAALTVLVVFLFLMSWRSTIITGLALPVSVLASFIAVWAFGFTLNTMSLLGLSLAIGILVDDAIVVRENIVRHMERGKDHVTAAREGTSEIGLAVAATTFSIVVVFLPIGFMGGLAEQWFAPFALTIACSVLVSLFVSFSLDPMLSAVWPDPETEGGKRSWVTRPLVRFNAWFDRQVLTYQKIIRWALRYRAAMVFIAVASFAGALAMPALGVVGSSFFPVQDRSELTIEIETPPGSSLEYTRRKALAISRLALDQPGVAYTYATIGLNGSELGEIYVRLVPKTERDRSQQEIADAIRTQANRLAGTTASIMAEGLGGSRQIEVQIRGPDLAVLGQLAERVMAEVEATPGAVDVTLSTRADKPEIEVTVDRDLAGTMGLGVGEVARALRPAFAGIDAGDWTDPTGRTRDVQVRLAPEARRSAADIGAIPLTVQSPDATDPMSTVIQVGQIATVRESSGPSQIHHLDRHRIVTVGANPEGRPLSEVVAGIEERIAGVAVPEGYRIGQGGETETQDEVFGRILLALGIAVLLMYSVLVIQFGSFLDPIPVMASLPLSLVGVMLALWITGSTLNLMSMIGVILLMGIVAKNAILLIDFAKWAQERGVGRAEAIVEAGGTRLRPIVMTSVAIIAGMLPVAIGTGEGADFRAPLGRAVIGGVITSTLLTLLVIPTFYDILAQARERVRARFRRRPAEETTDATRVAAE